MDLHSDRGRRITVDELNTTRLLAHARQQAHQRKFDDMLIVDSTHTTTKTSTSRTSCRTWKMRLPSFDGANHEGRPRQSMPTQIGYQDIGGRVTRYPMRARNAPKTAATATCNSAIAGWTP